MSKKKKDEAPKQLPEPKPEENSAAADLKELTEALKALKELTGSDFKIDIIDMPQFGKGQKIPFTLIENYNDAAKELEHHEAMSDMLTEVDLVETLLSYHNQGYDMPGLVDIYNKLERQQELSQSEVKNLRNWYVLVGMDLVYNV